LDGLSVAAFGMLAIDKESSTMHGFMPQYLENERKQWWSHQLNPQTFGLHVLPRFHRVAAESVRSATIFAMLCRMN
jgi:hypothetical protein